jgi:hypothetical protein
MNGGAAVVYRVGGTHPTKGDTNVY